MKDFNSRLLPLLVVALPCLGTGCPSAENQIGQQNPEDGGTPSRLDAGENGSRSYRWTEIQGPINLPPRLEGLALTFNQKMWVMGGEKTTGDEDNDVWSSIDGRTWTMATAAAGWSKRSLLAGTVFANRMWVIDGARQADVWSSTDGAQWQQALVTAPFSPRFSHGVLAFGDKLWILGGYGTGGTQVADVWSSADGANWVQNVSAAPWGQRDGFASAVFADKMWVIGGYVYNQNVVNDVWSSPDGIHWTQEPVPPFVARTAHKSAVFDNKLWIMGGVAYGGADLGDVWSTADGKTWTQMPPSDVPWSPRAGFATAVLDRLYLIGPRTGDVWVLEISN